VTADRLLAEIVDCRPEGYFNDALPLLRRFVPWRPRETAAAAAVSCSQRLNANGRKAPLLTTTA
jgi:hypothetical protein